MDILQQLAVEPEVKEEDVQKIQFLEKQKLVSDRFKELVCKQAREEALVNKFKELEVIKNESINTKNIELNNINQEIATLEMEINNKRIKQASITTELEGLSDPRIAALGTELKVALKMTRLQLDIQQQKKKLILQDELMINHAQICHSTCKTRICEFMQLYQSSIDRAKHILDAKQNEIQLIANEEVNHDAAELVAIIEASKENLTKLLEKK